jgi:hypothetical protein
MIIQQITKKEVADLCAQYHGYGSAGSSMTYAFGVIEDGSVVAAYAWQPPAPGAAQSICPEAPQGVLALSRMVAVPRAKRLLKHVSKPLMHQMKRLIDRSRWPVLVTYSDAGQGHTGYVYKCSGWEQTISNNVPFYTDINGNRASSYSGGSSRKDELTKGGTTTITRWEHWACPRGLAHAWMKIHGWRQEAIEGKVWRSGNQAHKYVRG